MTRFLPILSLVPLLTACQGNGELTIVDPDATTTGDPGTTSTTPSTSTGTATGTGTGGGGCGAVSTWDMTLEGQVVNGMGQPVPFADVWVEERLWDATPTVYGTASTDGGGFFLVQLDQVVDVEDCWGTILDYMVIAEIGPRSTERGINTPLFNAIQDGSLAADIAPLEL